MHHHAQPQSPQGLSSSAQVVRVVTVAMGLTIMLVPLNAIPSWAVAAAWIALFVLFESRGQRALSVASRLLDRPSPRIFACGLVLTTLAVCATASYAVFDGIPRVQDEANYYFQAKILASGRFYADSHVLADFFQYRFFVNDGRLYSLFQPGWPALLAIGHVLGIPAMVAPLLAATGMGCFYGAIRRLLDETTARVAAILLLASSTYIFQSSSMMAHGPAAALTLIVFYAAVRGWSDDRRRWFLTAGLVAGLLFSVRAATCVAVLAPFAACGLVMAVRGHIRWAHLGWIALGLLPGVAFQAIYNVALSGSVFVFPQDRYFALTEALANCHRLGIGDGIGCAYEHGPDLGPAGFTWERAGEVTARRLRQFYTDFWGSGTAVALATLPWLVARLRWSHALLAAVPVSLAVIYHFYYFHGILLGARYYFEGLAFAAALVASGIVTAARAAQAPAGSANATAVPVRHGQHVMATAVVAAVTVMVGLSVAERVPSEWRKYDSWWAGFKHFNETLDRADLDNAVVLVHAGKRMYWRGFWRNTPTFDGPVVVARDFGPTVNRQLRGFYPDRDFYRFDAKKDGGTFVPVAVRSSTDVIRVEAETKFPVADRHGGYVKSQKMSPWKVGASRGHQLFFDAKVDDATASFPQYIFAPGQYEVTGTWGAGPNYGRVELSVAGELLEPVFDGYSDRVTIKPWQAAGLVTLGAGVNTVTLRIAGRNDDSRGFVAGLDKLRLRRIGPATSPKTGDGDPRRIGLR